MKGLSETGRLGNATIREFADGEQKGWQAAGFYALAYDMTGVTNFTSGERVISVRGSDDGRAQDIINGYPTALAFPLTPQAALAVSFSRAVIGESLDPTVVNNTIITGHSLGAGIAGYISGLYRVGRRII